jgi:hypothetical protein
MTLPTLYLELHLFGLTLTSSLRWDAEEGWPRVLTFADREAEREAYEQANYPDHWHAAGTLEDEDFAWERTLLSRVVTANATWYPDAEWEFPRAFASLSFGDWSADVGLNDKTNGWVPVVGLDWRPVTVLVGR